jgi:hypothetical protein
MMFYHSLKHTHTHTHKLRLNRGENGFALLCEFMITRVLLATTIRTVVHEGCLDLEISCTLPLGDGLLLVIFKRMCFGVFKHALIGSLKFGTTHEWDGEGFACSPGK